MNKLVDCLNCGHSTSKEDGLYCTLNKVDVNESSLCVRHEDIEGFYFEKMEEYLSLNSDQFSICETEQDKEELLSFFDK